MGTARPTFCLFWLENWSQKVGFFGGLILFCLGWFFFGGWMFFACCFLWDFFFLCILVCGWFFFFFFFLLCAVGSLDLIGDKRYCSAHIRQFSDPGCRMWSTEPIPSSFLLNLKCIWAEWDQALAWHSEHASGLYPNTHYCLFSKVPSEMTITVLLVTCSSCVYVNVIV